jgi:hypothetical protein
MAILERSRHLVGSVVPTDLGQDGTTTCSLGPCSCEEAVRRRASTSAGAATSAGRMSTTGLEVTVHSAPPRDVAASLRTGSVCGVDE